MDILKKTSSHRYLAIATACGLMVLGMPAQIKSIRHIHINAGLRIQTTKIDPPRIAFDMLSQQARTDDAEYVDRVFLGEYAAIKKIPNTQGLTISRHTATMEYEDTRWIEDLPGHLQKRIVQAEARESVINQDWHMPGFKELATEKINQIQAEYESQIQPPPRVLVKTPDGRGIEQIRTSGVSVRQNPAHKIAGAVVAANGFVIGDSEIRISHHRDGERLVLALADNQTGKFNFELAEPKGALVAEAFDQNGVLLASGTSKIDGQKNEYSIHLEPKNEISGIIYNFSKASGFMLAHQNIKPILTVKSLAFAATINQEQTTDELGGFHFHSLLSGSASFIRTQAKGYYPGLHISFSGNKNALPVFPESLINSIINISRDRQLYSFAPENGSVVWGQVLLDGKPMAGVRVQALFHEDFRPIYLNGWIPDPNLAATGENGYFIFTNLPRGQHTIVALRDEEEFSHVNVEVDEHSISSVLLQHTFKTEVVEVKTYDAFSGQPLAARVDLQSLPDFIDINGYSEVRLPEVQRQSLLHAETADSDFAPTQLFYQDTDTEINIPMVRQGWLNQIQYAHKITSIPGTGTIIGFVQEGDYQAFLPHEEDFSLQNIVYFDAQGNYSQHSVPGGGFIIFNAPLGTQSVVLSLNKTEQLASYIVSVGDRAISVLPVFL